MATTLEHEVRHHRTETARPRPQLAEVLTLVGTLRGTIEKQRTPVAGLVRTTFGRPGERVEGPPLVDGLDADRPRPPRRT